MTYFLWLILALPHDLPVCSLWTARQPAWADLDAACPQFAGYRSALLIWPDLLQVRLVDVATGDVWCAQSAYSIPDTWTCQPARWDAYRIDIVWPAAQDWLCTVQTAENRQPTLAEIGNVCDTRALAALQAGQAEIQPGGARTPPPALQACMPPAPEYSQLTTADDLQVLAGRLNWYGLVDPVNLWQNRWDPAILNAARQTNVPGDVLKAVIGQESQFWPLWTGNAGEVGLIQLTDAGADLALRWSPSLFAQYCPLAIHPGRCRMGYDLLTGWEKGHVRAVLLAALAVTGTPLQAAEQVNVDILNYAQVLAAHWCYMAAVLPAEVAPSWDLALGVYHAGASCLRPDGSLCDRGRAYAERMK
jgi:hypothetical protein